MPEWRSYSDPYPGIGFPFTKKVWVTSNGKYYDSKEEAEREQALQNLYLNIEELLSTELDCAQAEDATVKIIDEAELVHKWLEHYLHAKRSKE